MKYAKKVVLGLLGLTLAGVIFFSNQMVKADTDITLADTKTAKVTMKKASDIALKEAKSGKLAAIDFNNEDGQLQYDVTILSSTTEKEYTIDAKSGEILKSSKEKLSTKDKEEKTIAKSNPKVSFDDLEKSLAKKYADAKIVDLDLEVKNGKLVYDVTLVDSKNETDVKVDATSGKTSKEKVTSLQTDDEESDEDED